MRFEEAIVHLREGKRLRIESWPKDIFIIFDFERKKVESNTYNKWELSESWFLDEDWEIYEEDKEEKIPVLLDKIEDIHRRLEEIEEAMGSDGVNISIFNTMQANVFERLNVVEKLVRDHAIGLQNVYKVILKK